MTHHGAGRKSAALIIGAVAMVLLVLGVNAVVRNDRSKPAGDTVEALVARVRLLTSISSDVMPTVATVEDAETFRLQNPELYREVEDNDRVLIWPDRMVVYSPKDDRIRLALPIRIP